MNSLETYRPHKDTKVIEPDKVKEWAKQDPFIKLLFYAGLEAYPPTRQHLHPISVFPDTDSKTFIHVPKRAKKAEVPAKVMTASFKARAANEGLDRRIRSWLCGYTASAIKHKDTPTVVASLVALVDPS